MRGKVNKKLGFLGPEGTFTEEIALLYSDDDKSVKMKEYLSIGQIVEDVAKGVISNGIVPLENSLEGSVSVTLDMLAAAEDVFIKEEIVYPISHCLMALNEAVPGDLKAVYSHIQAFSQCRSFLKENMPRASLVPTESTAAAARLVAESGDNIAAVAPARAASLFNLKIIAADIQDGNSSGESNGNVTRFVVLAKEDGDPMGRDKTSVILSIKDGAGSLYNVLGVFASRKVNLTKIESRPARKSLGEYLFFIDFEGHRKDNNIIALFEELESKVNYMKMLGSYPCFINKNIVKDINGCI